MYHADLVRPLHESLRDHAEHIGDRVAFSDDRRQVSYSELERRTRWIAAHLARLGTGRGERVAVHLDSGVEFIKYPGLAQDELGIWTAPGGDRVAWFSDPDGNNLSLTEFIDG